MECNYCMNEAKYQYGEYIGDTCNGLDMEYDEIADYFDIEEVATNE